MPIPSIAGVADVTLFRGPAAAADAPPDLLIEVPHGADRAEHYVALRQRLRGSLPDGLEDFFFVNTDVGAWQLGVAVAEQVVAASPRATVCVVRCLIPRTLIDTNRVPGAPSGALSAGGMTPGLPPYVRDPDDQALLNAMHAEYVALVEAAVDATCAAGGLVFIPHTYGPVTMGIERVDDDIVRNLRWALSPENEGRWPLRPEVDIIHRTGDGRSLAPPGLVEAVVAGYEADGVQVVEGDTYYLHESTMGYVWSARHPGRVLSLEVRRDLLVDAWTPFAEMAVRPAAAARFAAPIARAVIGRWADRLR